MRESQTEVLPLSAKLLVVIPCLNEQAYLEKLVNFLQATNSTQGLKFVIVDGGSTDGTLVIAERLVQQSANVFFLQNRLRIQAAGINLAVMTFGDHADYFIRIDAHADYPRAYLDNLLREASATSADSIVVAMHTSGSGIFQKVTAIAQNSRLGNGGSAHRRAEGTGFWVDHGHHALMRVAAFRSVGGYDESFTHNEDAELDLRLIKSGFRIWLTAKTAITYYPRTNAVALFSQYLNYGFGRARTILKHSSYPKLRQLLPVLILPAVLLAVAFPISALVLAPVFFWLSVCLGYGTFLAIKSKDPHLVLVGVSAIIMHFAWSLGFWKALCRSLLKRTRAHD
jgi:succinoglycan biosynthesis protein ExoA